MGTGVGAWALGHEHGHWAGNTGTRARERGRNLGLYGVVSC
jgi:hypothetical protein